MGVSTISALVCWVFIETPECLKLSHRANCETSISHILLPGSACAARQCDMLNAPECRRARRTADSSLPSGLVFSPPLRFSPSADEA